MDIYAIDTNTVIPRGKFGEYYKGEHKETKVHVAIKKLKLHDVQELNILNKVGKHPNIIELFDNFSDETNTWLVFDVYVLNDLEAYCKGTRPSIEFTLSVVTGVASAVTYLHTLPRPIIHRGIDPVNILLEGRGGQICARLGGFENSIETAEGIVFHECLSEDDSYVYKPPEFWSKNVITLNTVDVFSLGLVLDCLVHYGQGTIDEFSPPATKGDRTSMGKVMHGRAHCSLIKPVPGETKTYVKCKELITQMTKNLPRQRPPMAEVFEKLERLTYGGGTRNSDEGVHPSMKRASDEGVLMTDVLQENMKTVNVDIKVKGSLDECLGNLNPDFLKDIEDKYGASIELKKPNLQDEEQNPDVFNDQYTSIEVEDKVHGFAMSYAEHDIIDFRCDAIVNSTYPDLKPHTGRLAKAIDEAGGKEMTDECGKYVQDHGKLSIGEVFVSGSGELYAKYVFHVASPMWHTHGEEIEKSTFGTKVLGAVFSIIDGECFDEKHKTNAVIKEAVFKILKTADDLQLRKIALPAISSGGFGFPMEVSLLSIFSAAKEYFEKRKELGGAHVLREVCLVDKNPDVHKVITSVMGKCFGKEMVKTKEEKCTENNNTINVIITCGHDGGKTIEEIMTKIQAKCRGVVGEIQEVCPTWSPMHASDIYKLDELPANSTDFVQLVEFFKKTVENMDIVKIERVQNRKLYRDLLDHKHVIQQNVGKWSPDMEMKVWHGTSLDSANNIKRDGFDLKYCGKKFRTDYGRGLYFGHTAYVSNLYSARLMEKTEDLMYMFRCTVLLGNKHEAKGKKEGEAFKLPSGKHSVYWERCIYEDTPHKNIHEIVIFRNTQVYPDYLITYKKQK